MRASILFCACCCFCLIATPLSGTVSIGAPKLPDRRPPPPLFDRYEAQMEPVFVNQLAKRRALLGTPRNKLSDSQLEYFADRGTHRYVLQELIAEFGISPEENDRLARSGLSFIVRQFHDVNAWHWVALSDVIVRGRVKKITGFPHGPYHTRITLDVSETYKNCESRPINRLRDFWLLDTGPHQHDGHVDHRVDPTEPDLRQGEHVVLFAGREPHALRNLVGNALMNDQMDSLMESYGVEEKLFLQASKGSPGVLEIYRAYKVVRHNLSVKGGGFRVAKSTDVIDREHFRIRVQSIYEQQRQYCHNRVASKEARR